MDEHTAINLLKKGDIAGLEYLVRAHQLKAVRVAKFITRDLALAEDVVQDCFLQAFRSIGGFDSHRAFEPWFMRMVTRAAVATAQKNARKIPIETEADEIWFETLLGSEPAPEAEIEKQTIRAEITQAIDKLSPRQRAVIIQRYYLGWSEKEMVAELSIAPGSVKWLLNTARSRLRALLAGRSVK